MCDLLALSTGHPGVHPSRADAPESIPGGAGCCDWERSRTTVCAYSAGRLHLALCGPAAKSIPARPASLPCAAAPVPGDLAGERLDAGAAAGHLLQRLLQLRRRRRHRQLLCAHRLRLQMNGLRCECSQPLAGSPTAPLLRLRRRRYQHLRLCADLTRSTNSACSAMTDAATASSCAARACGRSPRCLNASGMQAGIPEWLDAWRRRELQGFRTGLTAGSGGPAGRVGRRGVGRRLALRLRRRAGSVGAAVRILQSLCKLRLQGHEHCARCCAFLHARVGDILCRGARHSALLELQSSGMRFPHQL